MVCVALIVVIESVLSVEHVTVKDHRIHIMHIHYADLHTAALCGVGPGI